MVHRFMMLVHMALRAVLMDVQMAVDMAVQVGMNDAAVPVLMGMHMLMTVGMLQIYGVFRKKHRAHGHDRQRNIKLYLRTFSQQKQAKGHAEKGRNRVKSAGLCRARPYDVRDCRDEFRKCVSAEQF